MIVEMTQMQAAKELVSKNLIDVALKNVRRRFLDLTSRQFAADSFEFDTVKYRAKRVFDDTVTGGKNSRSMLALQAFRALNPKAETAEMHRMAELAALLEMIQGFYIIIDDVMDGAETRRGKPCWYKNADIGLSAVNDALLLDVFVDDIIRELYPEHPQVDRLCSAYQKSKRATVIGQLLDTASVRDINAFTWDRYEQLVAFKTSHYTYFHPIEMAMLVSDRLDNHSLLRQLAYRIGFLFQSQDDALDVFGDPTLTGKVGTDIQDGKCTWISVRAVQKLQGKPELDDFRKHYGSPDEASVKRIKVLIEQLRLREEFLNFEKRYSEKVKTDIDQVPEHLSALKPVLYDAVNSLIERKK
ncbi:unnamed protein product [Cylicocyclus nassatus]|uniref:Farnesyl pyrophosphate synthase n=1 Tax=Cylicocyclus nassatus TaxID=53992 RepID=A0AA36GFG5_CYLNA|nr:unnamed protein product [Cylicocyclus nassatus]